VNTSGSFRGLVGKRGTRKVKPPSNKGKKPLQQEIPNIGLSSYGRRRKSKMRGI
jgi:hypothetical protein